MPARKEIEVPNLSKAFRQGFLDVLLGTKKYNAVRVQRRARRDGRRAREQADTIYDTDAVPGNVEDHAEIHSISSDAGNEEHPPDSAHGNSSVRRSLDRNKVTSPPQMDSDAYSDTDSEKISDTEAVQPPNPTSCTKSSTRSDSVRSKHGSSGTQVEQDDQAVAGRRGYHTSFSAYQSRHTRSMLMAQRRAAEEASLQAAPFQQPRSSASSGCRNDSIRESTDSIRSHQSQGGGTNGGDKHEPLTFQTFLANSALPRYARASAPSNTQLAPEIKRPSHSRPDPAPQSRNNPPRSIRPQPAMSQSSSNQSAANMATVRNPMAQTWEQSRNDYGGLTGPSLQPPGVQASINAGVVNWINAQPDHSSSSRSSAEAQPTPAQSRQGRNQEQNSSRQYGSARSESNTQVRPPAQVSTPARSNCTMPASFIQQQHTSLISRQQHAPMPADSNSTQIVQAPHICPPQPSQPVRWTPSAATPVQPTVQPHHTHQSFHNYVPEPEPGHAQPQRQQWNDPSTQNRHLRTAYAYPPHYTPTLPRDPHPQDAYYYVQPSTPWYTAASHHPYHIRQHDIDLLDAQQQTWRHGWTGGYHYRPG